MVAVHEKLFSIKFFAFTPGWDKEKPWAKFILRCILNHKEANTNVKTDEPSNGYPNNDTNFKNEERISVVDRSEQESSNGEPNDEDMITSQRRCFRIMCILLIHNDFSFIPIFGYLAIILLTFSFMAAMPAIKVLSQIIEDIELLLKTEASSLPKRKIIEGEEREQAYVWDVHAASASIAMQDFADDFLVFLELVIMAHDMNIGVFSPVFFKDPELDLDMT
ncbi:hypothetical protein BELL_0632g00060 [Botrytis elliptica]|uniref:Uncharacterized protein n=1 Tax=Botrytis elliptica TaxID=278938 RepID=A0A4Z1JNX2_9HELO|nr:hypothetical protein BELL_0632g00060 [Botrytis elliptica]